MNRLKAIAVWLSAPRFRCQITSDAYAACVANLTLQMLRLNDGLTISAEGRAARRVTKEMHRDMLKHIGRTNAWDNCKQSVATLANASKSSNAESPPALLVWFFGSQAGQVCAMYST